MIPANNVGLTLYQHHGRWSNFERTLGQFMICLLTCLLSIDLHLRSLIQTTQSVKGAIEILFHFTRNVLHSTCCVCILPDINIDCALPSKHNTFTQCRVNVGPASKTTAQPYLDIGLTSCVFAGNSKLHGLTMIHSWDSFVYYVDALPRMRSRTTHHRKRKLSW